MLAAPKVTLPDVTEKQPAAQHLRLLESEATDSVVPRAVGRYTLHEEFAFGGMGAVHLGVLRGAAGFLRPVAIKRLHSHVEQLAASAELRQEAWLGSHVRHPNVVPVLDLVDASGKLFLVMEFVLGDTMARLLRKSGMMPVNVAVAVLSDVLYGLHAAHTATGVNGRSLGIVHRDVSPQNILVGVDGVARILDFGVAKCVAADEKLCEPTEVGFVKGKIGYIAPEQLLSEPLDARTDVFAAGVVLWEALTGQRLFRGRDPMQALLRLADEGTPPPSRYNRAVTPKLDQLVARALHRSPELRFQSAEEFAEELQTVAARARPGHVGAYVEKAAADSIDKQRYLLRCIQAPGRVFASHEAIIREVAPQEETTSSFPTQLLVRQPRSGKRRKWWLYRDTINLAVGVSCLIVAGLVCGFSNRGAAGSPVKPQLMQAPESKPATLGQAVLARPEPAVAVASEPVSVPTPGEPTAVTTSSSDAPVAIAMPSARSKAKPLRRRALSLPVYCDPPYLVDSDGIKRIKRGCR
jgi:eukaryotic-like serine/threonine-protein kinase